MGSTKHNVCEIKLGAESRIEFRSAGDTAWIVARKAIRVDERADPMFYRCRLVG